MWRFEDGECAIEDKFGEVRVEEEVEDGSEDDEEVEEEVVVGDC